MNNYIFQLETILNCSFTNKEREEIVKLFASFASKIIFDPQFVEGVQNAN